MAWPRGALARGLSLSASRNRTTYVIAGKDLDVKFKVCFPQNTFFIIAELKSGTCTIIYEGTAVLSKHGGRVALYPAKGCVRNEGGDVAQDDMGMRDLPKTFLSSWVMSQSEKCLSGKCENPS